MKKLVELSEEELLKILESNEESFTFSDDVLNFIETYKLETGTNTVRIANLHIIYSNWSKFPVSLKAFTSKFVDSFNTQFIDGERYALLKQDPLEIAKLAERFKPGSKKRPLTKSKSFKQHFEAYLKHYSIVPGTTFVPSRILYKLYSDWTDRTKKLNETAFDQLLALYFKQKAAYRTYWYGLDQSITQHLTGEMIDDIKKKKFNEEKEDKSKIAD
jgi:hypothetical protein